MDKHSLIPYQKGSTGWEALVAPRGFGPSAVTDCVPFRVEAQAEESSIGPCGLLHEGYRLCLAVKLLDECHRYSLGWVWACWQQTNNR